LRDAGLKNTIPPFELDVSTSEWPELKPDAVFTANSVHIMDHDNVVNLMQGVGAILEKHGCFVIYGPFNYNNEYTSESNKKFDQWLKDRDPSSCIKDFESLDLLAIENGMQLVKDYEMPANNRILHFVKD